MDGEQAGTTNGREALDDADLRRTLGALLSAAASASRRAAASDSPPGLPPIDARGRAMADPPEPSGPVPDPSRRDLAAESWIVGRGGLLVLGLGLTAIGLLLLVGTLGFLALDAARLADCWPLVLVAIGLLVVLEALAPGRRAEPREPARNGAVAAGVAPTPDADEVEGRLDRLLAARMANALTPVEPALVNDPPRPRLVGAVPLRGDLAAALFELQGLRRHGLISKRQYRAMRADLVTRMTPSLASLGWDEPSAATAPAATDERGSGNSAQPSPGYPRTTVR
jgi:hypothetical protein